MKTSHAIALRDRTQCEIEQKNDFGGRPCESWSKSRGEEIDYQAIMLLLNTDE